MEQPKVDKWLDQNRTRGSTWSRHMAPPEPDMWRDQKTTRGAAGSRHMASWEGDTWLCQRGSSWRQLPAWHGATSAASMARCHVSCQRGACHVAASSMTKLMTICISHRRKAVPWRITCSSLEKKQFYDEFGRFVTKNQMWRSHSAISNSSLIRHKTLSVTKTVLSMTKTVCHRKEVLY